MIPLRFLVFDVDGVFTDGSIRYDDRGIESKVFHVRDGLAVRLAREAGLLVGVLTGRNSACVALRVREMGIHHAMHGVDDKGRGIADLCAAAGVTPELTAYMGDDLIDLPAMRRCAYAMTVADGAPEVRRAAHFITQAPGGRAAVREAIEHVLRGQGLWDRAIERFLA